MTAMGQQHTSMANVILSANTGPYNSAMQQAIEHTSRLHAAVKSVEAAMDGMIGRFGRTLIKGSLFKTGIMATDVAMAATFEKQLSTLAGRAEATGMSMHSLKGGIEAAFNKFPVSRESVVALTETITQLGITSEKEIGKLTQTFIKLGAATGEGAQQLAQSLIPLTRMMGSADSKQIEGYANALTVLSAKAGVSATSIGNFAQALAPLARQAGIGTTSLLGISTAFSKAGADGFVAANSFNSMISDITKLSANGSPELAKYSNLIGVTVDQFKKMDKANAFVQIVETINKQGPRAIDTLNRLGLDGVRSVSAFQSLAQSGDIAGQVGLAKSSVGKTDTLDKSSKAALTGFTDGLIQLRNTATQTGTIIGTTFLGPLTKVLKVMNLFKAAITPLEEIKAVFSSIAVVGTAMTGVLLVAAGWMTKLGMSAFFRKSRPGIAFTEGLGRGWREEGADPAREKQRFLGPIGRAGVRIGGLPRAASRADERYRERQFIAARERDEAVIAAGGRLPFGHTPDQADEERRAQPVRTLGRRIRALPFRALRGYWDSSTEFAQDAGLRGENRPSNRMQRGWEGGMNRFREWRGLPIQPPAPFVDREPPGRLQRIQLAGDPRQMAYKASQAEYTKSTAAVTAAQTQLNAAVKAGIQADIKQATVTLEAAKITQANSMAEMKIKRGEAENAAKAAFELKSLGRQALAAANSLRRMSFATTKTAVKEGASLLAGGIGAMGRGALGMVGGVGGALFIGAPLAFAAGQKFMAKRKESMQVDNSDPLKLYNDQLGQATRSLVNFAKSTDDASNKLSNISNETKDTATQVTDTDMANFGKSGTEDPRIKSLTKHSKNDVGAGIALARSYNFENDQQVTLFKRNLIGAGWTKDAVQQVLEGLNNPEGGYKKAGGDTDYAPVYAAIHNTQNKGFWGGSNASKSGNDVAGAVLGGLDVQRSSDVAKHSTDYANLHYAQENVKFLGGQAHAAFTGGAAGAGDNLDQDAFKDALVKLVGGGGRTKGAITRHLADSPEILAALKSEDTAKQSEGITNLLSTFGAGNDWLKGLNISNRSGFSGKFSTDTTKWSGLMAEMLQQPDEGLQNNPVARTEIGGAVTKNADIQEALTSTGSPTAQYKGATALLGAADEGSGGIDQLITRLDELQHAAGNAADPIYKLAAAAKTMAQTYETAFVAPSRSGTENLAASRSAFETAKTNNAIYGTDDTSAEVQSAEAAYGQQLQAQKTFELQSLDSLKQYSIQKDRQQKAYDLQVTHSKRDFQKQQDNADADHRREESRAIEDHNTQLARQAQEASKNVYDPWTRQGAKYTASAESLVQNLQDQNERIQKQLGQVQQLKDMGLSQQSIDTLDLTSANNDQQVNSIVQGMVSNPGLIQQVNDLTQARLGAVTSITQTNLSDTWRNSEQDFHKTMDRSTDDFHTSTQRAIDANTVSMQDMADAFELNAKQAADDMNMSFTSMIQSVDQNLKDRLPEVGALLGQLPKNLAGQFTTAFDQINAAMAQTASQMATVNAAIVAAAVAANNLKGSQVAQATGYANKRAANADMYGGKATGGPVRGPGTGTSDSVPMNLSNGEFVVTAAATGKNMQALHAANAGAKLTVQGMATGGLASNGQINMAMLKQISTIGAVPTGTGGGVTNYQIDQSTVFAGDISVQANDADALIKSLQAKARLDALSRPKGTASATNT